jgi:putative transposase
MTRRLKRLSHSVYECKYHIVFCPKYRHRVFRDEIAKDTHQMILELCQRKDGIEVLELNVQPDHIHLVVSIAPKYAVSEVMGYLKGELALRLFHQYEQLGKRFWGRQLWARGYCVSTVGVDEEEIRKYVKWQERQEKQAELIQQRLL